MKDWVKGAFSDGTKPSLSRHLLALCVIVACGCVIAQKELPQVFGEVVVGLCGMAGWSRTTASKETPEENDEPA